ncbi:MAG: fibrobacter succinogenes major paralogous domain-containing protein [Bacteroidales bacterium]|nr:fibrobacter succinogenes major paralogous domain-containing protein [Bacteroidales bacterium]
METHSAQTNANGLFSVKIGAGSPVSGAFNTVDWTLGEYSVRTEIDMENNGQYPLTATTELLSVPYALHAQTAERVLETASETDPVFLQSLAYSITEEDTSRWNRKSDGVFAYSVSDSIRAYAVLLSGNQTIQGEKTFIDSVRFISGIDVNNQPVKNVGTPQRATDAVNKEYVDVLGQKIDSVKNIGYMDEINILKSEIELLKKSLEEVQLSTGQLVKDIDGNVYKTMKYGDQTWMIENLRVTRYNDGTPIDYAQSDTAWSNRITQSGNDYTAPAMYCFRDTSIENIIKYGALYNWFTVNPANNKQVCPSGWHVPSETEYNTLNSTLLAAGYGYDNRISGANKHAKAMAMGDEWEYSTVEGSPGNTDYPEKKNASKFSAIPVGYRNVGGSFTGINRTVAWWSTTTSYYMGMYTAVYASISFNEDYLTICKPGTLKPQAQSIRCVKD